MSVLAWASPRRLELMSSAVTELSEHHDLHQDDVLVQVIGS